MRDFWILALLALTGCGDARVDQVWSSSRSVLNSAATVELSWLAVPDLSRIAVNPGDKPAERPPAPDMDYWHWADKSAPQSADATAARKLADVLLDEKSYYRGPPKACLPMPGVHLKFIDGKRVANVRICFECRMLFVRGPDGAGGGDDFDPGAAALIAALKAAFPKDAEIQALK